MKLFALVFIVFLAVACQELLMSEKTCTTAGCGHSFLVSFNAEDDASSIGDYSISILMDNDQSIRCTFTLKETGSNCLLNDCINNRVCDQLRDVYYSAPEESVFLYYPQTEGELSIKVEQDDKIIASLVTDPRYERSQPNGPDCEPSCLYAHTSVTVSR
ncbi:MAG: hypothetical protein AB8G77_07245 [Rhodothermales bacterium]